MTRIDAAAARVTAASRGLRAAEKAWHKAWERGVDARKRYARAIEQAIADELPRHDWRRSSERGYVVAEFGSRTRVARLVRPYCQDRTETSLKVRDMFVHLTWTADLRVRLRIHHTGAAKLGITGIGGQARRRRLWSIVHQLLVKRDALSDRAGIARVRSIVDDIRKEPA